MKILKPNWVNLDGQPIFSIDIHPDGSRFAIGGHGGEDSGKIIIWNMVSGHVFCKIHSPKPESYDDDNCKLNKQLIRIF